MIASAFLSATFALILKNRFLEAILLMTGAVFVWAAFIRKPSDPDQHRKHHWQSSKRKRRESEDELEESTGFSGDKRRRKRRKRRSNNPTLAETGGLPPVRQIDPHSKD